jgi:hypothetical protein
LLAISPLITPAPLIALQPLPKAAIDLGGTPTKRAQDLEIAKGLRPYRSLRQRLHGYFLPSAKFGRLPMGWLN